MISRNEETVGKAQSWVRPFLKAVGKWTVTVIFPLPILWTGVHVAENFRSEHSEKVWTQEFQAGAALPDLSSIEMAPISDDENFAKAPAVQRFFHPKESPFSGRLRSPEDANARGNFRKALHANLEAWAKANGTTDLLNFLRPLDGSIRELETASHRRSSRMAGGVDPETLLGSFPRKDDLDILGMRPVVRILSLRALCRLRDAQSQLALNDVILALRVIAHLQNETGIVNHTTRQSLEGMILQAVWEGLESGLWSDAQLSELQDGLGRLDEIASLERYFKWERLADWFRIEEMIKQRSPVEAKRWWDKAFPEMQATLEESGDGNPSDLKSLRASRPSTVNVYWMDFIVPRGWLIQNRVKRDRIYVNYFLKAVDPARHMIHRDILNSLPQWWRKGGKGPYTFLAAPIGMDFETWFFPQAARCQSYLDLARVACALERYRLAHQTYPEKLRDLAPSCISALPVDVCSGGELNYSPTEGSGFVLKATGWGGMGDDRGLSVGERESPDCVWQSVGRIRSIRN